MPEKPELQNMADGRKLWHPRVGKRYELVIQYGNHNEIFATYVGMLKEKYLFLSKTGMVGEFNCYTSDPCSPAIPLRDPKSKKVIATAVNVISHGRVNKKELAERGVTLEGIVVKTVKVI